MVATDVAWISEQVEGENGFLIPTVDAGTLAVKMGELVANPELRKQIREESEAG